MQKLARKQLGKSAKLSKTLKRIQVLFKKNRFKDARPLCEWAFMQGARDSEFLNKYGLILRAFGEFQDALKVLYAAHEENSGNAEILNSLGQVFLDMKDAEAAITMFKRATTQDEKYFDAWINLGKTLSSVGRYHAAELAFTGAYYLDPANPVPKFQIGQIKIAQHKYQRAAEIFDELIETEDKPDVGIRLMRLQIAVAIEDMEYVATHLDGFDASELGKDGQVILDAARAQFYIIYDRYDEAIEILERISATGIPGHIEHKVHLGGCYGLAGRVGDGIAILKSLLKECPEHAMARHNLALLQFTVGDLEDGYRNYEYRWKLKEFVPQSHRFDAPFWQGEPLEGKRIVVWKEQGIGDEVRFCSSLPELHERGGSITLECSEKLVPLWQLSFPWATVRAKKQKQDADEEKKEEFDFQIPVGSLGTVLRKSVDVFREKQKPWIARNRLMEMQIRNQLAIQPDELLVGVCWNSSLQDASRQKSFLSSDDLIPLKTLPNARWLNLQYSSTYDEVTKIRNAGLELNHYVDLDQKNDLVGACNLIGACDLVITVAVSVGDLAGGVVTPMIHLTPEKSELFLGTDHVPWFVNCKSFPIKTFETHKAIERLMHDWPEILSWAKGFKLEARNAEALSTKGKHRPSLDLEYHLQNRQ
ncbi:MAG: tetratricopeptide repeat protein [Pseudomonadota bacterium]